MTSSLKQKLAGGDVTVGSWLSLGHVGIAEIVARAGFDWVVIDLEHTVITLDIAGDLIRTIDLCGVTPLVRLTSNDPDQIKRVLDAGAHGILVPNVNSREEAVRAVAATRYGPEGTRGVGLSRAQGYGARFQDYLKWQREAGPVVIVQIESRHAVGCLEDILTVPGVDAFMVGPYDLSCSLGMPGEFDRPEFAAAMAQVRATGKRLRVPSGTHIVEPDLKRLEQAIRDGYGFIAYSVDQRVLDVGFRQSVTKWKETKA
jgi:2-dehydro-3-deoxyglucarate aldolase